MYSRAVATLSTPWNGNVKLSQKTQFKLPGGSKFKHFMIHLGFALENSEMNMKCAHSEKLQLTTSPKNPFPQQNTPWVPNIDVAPRCLEEAFGAAFHAHVDGLEPLSVPMRKTSLRGRKNHHVPPLQQTQQKANTQRSCKSRLKISPCWFKHWAFGVPPPMLFSNSHGDPQGYPKMTPETIFRVWFKLRPFP